MVAHITPIMLAQCLLQHAIMISARVPRGPITIKTRRHRNNVPRIPSNDLLHRRQVDGGVLALNFSDSICTKEQSHRLQRNNHGLAFIRGHSNLRVRTAVPPSTHCQRYFSKQAITPTICSKPYNVNRYERFRQCLTSISRETLDPCPTFDRDASNDNDLIDVGKHAMEVLSSNRRSFNRTWKRMKPLIELIASACGRDGIEDNFSKDKKHAEILSIADVGCDHGILSLSLACMAWAASQRENENKENQWDGMNVKDTHIFSQVFGTDVSSTALKNGGRVSLEKMLDAMMPIGAGTDGDVSEKLSLPISFRIGSGLEPLDTGEADAVVLAGMGVHTQLDILFGNNKDITSAGAPLPVDSVQTQQIFLQPTNSRPQHLVILYDRLQQSGEWVLQNESIAFVGGRWYINSFFDRCSCDRRELGDSYCFPGHYLVHSDDGTYDLYMRHHIQWLREDYERPKCLLEDEDRRWLEYITTSEEHGRWKSLVSWFVQ